jgi:hypothetical protein
MTNNATNITSPQTQSAIDPTQGLIQYVQAVKPYHTKIMDVLVEYVYTETISTTVQERWNWIKEDGTPGITFIDGTTLQARALPYAASTPAINVATYDAVAGGVGYLDGVYNHVLLLGGTGSGAEANITVSSGVIAKLSGLQPGSGYAPGPAPIQVIDMLNPSTVPYLNVPLLGGTGTGATANITVTSFGTVASVVLTNGGTGYTPSDTLVMGGSIFTVAGLVTGTGYTSGTYTNVSLIGGTGVGAKATIVVVGGVVTTVTITAAGIGYLVGDILTVFPATVGGIGAGFSITVASTVGTLFGITVPLVGGIANGVVTFVEITKSGTGYTVGDVLTVPNAPMSGPIGTPTSVGSFVVGYNYTIVTVGTPVTVVAGSFVVGYPYTILVPGSTDFTLIGAPNNNVGTIFGATGPGVGTGTATIVTDFTFLGASNNTIGTTFTATSTGAGNGNGTATTATGLGFGVRVKSSDLHAATTISEILVVELALIFFDSISASMVDVRPVGYGLDTYSTNVGGGYGTNPDPDGLTITAIGSDGITYTMSAKEQNQVLNSTFMGSIVGTMLTVTSIQFGSPISGQVISGANVVPGTTVLGQIMPLTMGEVLGGIGRYTVSIPQIVGSEVMSTLLVNPPSVGTDGFDLDLFDE